MKRTIFGGLTSVSLPIFIQDTSSTTGGGLDGVTHASSGLVIEYRRHGQSTWTTITPVTKTLGTYVSGGIVANGSLAGRYELDMPDAAFASGVRFVEACVRGVANMLPVLIEIELNAVNYQDGASFGLSRLTEIKAKTDLLPANPAAVSDIPTRAEIATSVEETQVLSRLDSMIESNGGGQFRFDTIALSGGGGGGTDWTVDERTAIRSILGIPVSGSTPTDPIVGILDTIRDAFPPNFEAMEIDADGKVILQPTQTGVTIPTVTTVTSGVTVSAIGANVISAASLASDVGEELANALLDLANGVEASTTLRQALRLVVAAMAGKVNGAAGSTVHIRNLADTLNRITATVDADGNRTAVTTNLG